MMMGNVFHLVSAVVGITKWNSRLDTKKSGQPVRHLNFGEKAFL